jgi:hypothetical protein
MRRLGLVALLLLVASLALTAAGCGGDNEPSGATAADEWADGFCTAVTTWTDELQRIGDSLGDPSSLSRDAIEQAAQEASRATDQLVDDIRALGTPDTESGQEVRDTLDTLADTLDTEKADIEQAVEGISGLTGLPAAITTIGGSLSAMGSALQDAQDAIDEADVDGELKAAFEQSDACNEVTG